MVRSVLVPAILAMATWSSSSLAQGTCATFGGTFAKWGAGGNPTVKINWSTFVAQGIPTANQPFFENSVKETIERWKQVSAANVRPTYGGITTSTTAGANEILITMEVDDPQSQSVLARAFLNVRTIIFYRKSNSGQNFPWVFFWPSDPDPVFGFDIQAVMMHEFGHMLGLKDHSDVARATLGFGCGGNYVWANQRFGPNTDDVTRLQNVYGTFNSLRMRTERSTNNAGSWALQANSLTSDATVTTTIEPSGLRDATATESYVLAFTNNTKRAEFVVASDPAFATIIRRGTVHPTQSSWYGPAIDGESAEWMVAYVDPAFDDMRVRVRYTTDAGATWISRDPSLTDFDGSSRRAMGSPGVARSATNGNVWYLAYPVLDLTTPTRTGWTIILRSANDGSTWSIENSNADPNFFSTNAGVALTQHASDAFVAGVFSWENVNPQNAAYGYRWNKDTLAIEVSPDTSSKLSMFRPTIGRNNSASFLYMAITEKDGSKLWSTRRAPGNTDWDAFTLVGDVSVVAPAMAADKDQTNIYLYYFN